MPIFTGTNLGETITASDDADIITGLGGNDTLRGGGGGDVYVWNPLTDGSDTIQDNVAGGIDILRVTGNANDFRLTVGSSNLTLVYIPTGASVTFSSQHSSLVNIIERIEYSVGGAFTDLTTGYTYTASGTLYGGLFNDNLTGGTGVDTLNGNAGDDVLTGLGGVDRLNGDDGADILSGGADNDRLEGGNGDDRLIGGAGNDILNGGNGLGDWAWYLDETSGITASLVSGTVTGATSGTDTLTGIENLYGSRADDTLIGTSIANVINGGSGNDNITSGDGDDRVFGGAGNDSVSGDAGRDTIYGDEPFSPSQTATAAGVTPFGEPVALSVTGARWDPNATTSVFGFVGSSAQTSSQLNVVYVIDVSGSMTDTFQGTEIIGDENGDGQDNSLLDGAIASYVALTDSLVSAGLGSTATITVVAFSTGASIVYDGLAGLDSNSNGIPDVIDSLRALRASGSTNYEAGLSKSIEALSARNGGSNYLFFLSDGAPNSGTYTDEVSILLNQYQTTIRAIGLGNGASLPALDLVDDGVANLSAERVLTPSQLTAGLSGSTIDPGLVDRVELLVNGVLQATIAASDLIVTPFGLRFDVDLAGLSTVAADTIVARLILTGPNPITIMTSINIAQVNAPVGGNDTLTGGIGDDLIYGNGGVDTVSGNEGNDILNGGEGSDALNGGDGIDTADYSDDILGVTASLLTNTATGLSSGSDTFVSIENLAGGSGNDTLIAGNGAVIGSAPDIVKGASVLNGTFGTAISLANSFDVIASPIIGNSTTIPHATVSATGSGGPEFYVFTTTAANQQVTVDIDQTSSGFDSVIALLDAAGTVLQTQDDNGLDAGSTSSNDSLLQYTISAPGTYYVRVVSYQGTTVPLGVAYTMHVSLTGSPITTQSGFGAGSGLFGGSGDDILVSGSGADQLDGGAGFDLVSYASSLTPLTADLQFSSTNNGAAAGDRYSSVEGLRGTTGGDILSGNALGNRLEGMVGNDILSGRDGNDVLMGGSGGDQLFGGEGSDTASYASAASAIYLVAGDAGATSGDAAGDVLNSIENITGTAFSDVIGWGSGNNVLDGGAGNDELYGQDGNDVLLGGVGGDFLSGGLGVDTASYASAASGVYAYVGDSSGWTGDAGGDNWSSIENLRGSAFDDVLGMGNDNNVIDGGAGNDVLYGNGGADTLIGGAGFDTANYSTAAAGMYLFFGDAGAWNSDAAGDGLSSIEAITGTNFNDIIGMDDNNNRLVGGAGDDILYGEGGGDQLFGNGGFDTVSYALAPAGVYIFWTDLGNATGDAAGDSFFSEIESIVGTNFDDVIGMGNFNDLLVGGGGNDVLHGLGGGDRFFGNDGFDTVSYATAGTGVYVFLRDLGNATGDAAGDGEFSSIESIVGSNFNDVIGLGDFGDTIIAGGGNDILFGLGGNDTLWGGTGSDLFAYNGAGFGADTIVDFQDGADRIDFSRMAGVNFASLSITTVAGGVQVALGGDTILLSGVGLGQVSSADFLFA